MDDAALQQFFQVVPCQAMTCGPMSVCYVPAGYLVCESATRGQVVTSLRGTVCYGSKMAVANATAASTFQDKGTQAKIKELIEILKKK